MLTFAVVLMRMIDLVSLPRQWNDEESEYNLEKIGAYVLMFGRFACPFFIWFAGSKVNAFGMYTIYVLFFEAALFGYVTFRVLQTN